MKFPLHAGLSRPLPLLMTVLLLVTLTTGASPSSHSLDELRARQWMHGSSQCDSSDEPTFEEYAHDSLTYIFRQNKCLTYEAPFLYLLLADERALLLDSGALEGAAAEELAARVRALAGDRKLWLLHSHGHRDHMRGDEAFAVDPDTEIIDADEAKLSAFLGIDGWPEGQGSIDLGGRVLVAIPTPGHQEEAISVFDPLTGWLLTGDTIYPGFVYVKDWDSYRRSIRRLSAFADAQAITAIMGGHIEAKNQPGEYYEVGGSFQPDEAPLPLGPQTLTDLQLALDDAPSPTSVELDVLQLVPMNALQRMISDMARWLMD